MRGRWVGVLVALWFPAVAAAQDAGPGAPCARPEIPQSARDFCATVAQAAVSAQPQLGILIAGGNVTPGNASSAGLRLGLLPGVSLTAKVNAVLARFPSIQEAGGSAGRTGEESTPVPALSGSATVGVFPGLSLAPTLGGIGAVDLLGSAAWLPLKAQALEGAFGESSATTAFGVGARLGLLKESFAVPAVSISVMHHRLGRVEYGDVCPSPAAVIAADQDGYRLQTGACAAGGDRGEFAFDLTDWSTRAQISKNVLVFGLAAGVGYDRWNSGLAYGFRSRCPVLETEACFVRVTDAELDNDRWSAFANASLGGVLGKLVFEAGWLQGAEPIAGYPGASNDFDPEEGTLFGSVGLRLSF